MVFIRFYFLGGYSSGGALAYEVTRQLGIAYVPLKVSVCRVTPGDSLFSLESAGAVQNRRWALHRRQPGGAPVGAVMQFGDVEGFDVSNARGGGAQFKEVGPGDVLTKLDGKIL